MFFFCFHFFPVIEMQIFEKKKMFERHFKLFLNILLKFEINWTRTGQVIRLRNDINISETPYTSQMIPNV